MTTVSNGKVGGMVSGEDKATKRAVVVTLGTEDDGTHVNVTFSVKRWRPRMVAKQTHNGNIGTTI